MGCKREWTNEARERGPLGLTVGIPQLSSTEHHKAMQSSLNELGIIVKVVVECEDASHTSNTFVVSSFHFAVCHQVLSLFVMQQKMILYLIRYSLNEGQSLKKQGRHGPARSHHGTQA